MSLLKPLYTRTIKTPPHAGFKRCWCPLVCPSRSIAMPSDISRRSSHDGYTAFWHAARKIFAAHWTRTWMLRAISYTE